MDGSSQSVNGIEVNYLPLAGFALLIYDYCLTFRYEVELIWTKLDRVASLVFLCLRYMTIGLLAVDCYEKLYPGTHNSRFCEVWVIMKTYVAIVCLMAIHILVAIRVNAFHGNRRFIRRLLILCGSAYVTSTSAFFTIIFTTKLKVHGPFLPGGCLSGIPSYLWAGWLPTAFFETLLFALTCCHIRNHFTKWKCHPGFEDVYKKLYRDGVIFYIVISICSIGSLILWALANDSRWFGVSPAFPSSVMAVVATRYMINLRLFASGAPPMDGEDTTDNHTKSESVVLVTSPSFHFRVGETSGEYVSTVRRGQDDPSYVQGRRMETQSII